MKRNSIKTIARGFKLWLARRGLVVITEIIDHEKNIYRVYCPKCRTWHVAYLSGYPEDEHFHLPCNKTLYK